MRCGAKLEELHRQLGPHTDIAADGRPRRWKPRLHYWGAIEVLICHSTVISLSLQTWRDTAQLPGQLGLGNTPIPCRLSHVDVMDSLNAAEIAWQDAPELLVIPGDGDARGVRTMPANVELVFWDHDGTGRNDTTLRLKGAYKSDPNVRCGPHPDSGPPDGR
ncbi:hypothetical protein [Actinopolymorpha sp. B9G3]|uniref:hypothetical protein n=1 Tax=Actinopolymorpha sp. B9G3 TaxID=3158970 RepID=UPI0032D9306A